MEDLTSQFIQNHKWTYFSLKGPFYARYCNVLGKQMWFHCIHRVSHTHNTWREQLLWNTPCMKTFHLKDICFSSLFKHICIFNVFEENTGIHSLEYLYFCCCVWHFTHSGLNNNNPGVRVRVRRLKPKNAVCKRLWHSSTRKCTILTFIFVTPHEHRETEEA